MVQQAGANHRWYLAAVLAIGALLLALVVFLPISLLDLLLEIIAPRGNTIYELSVPAEGEGSGPQSRLHLSAVALDPLQQRLTLRVNGHQLCRPECASGTQIVFLSFRPNEARSSGLPPSARVSLPATTTAVTQSIDLPVQGNPVLYPFDDYQMLLGLAVLRVLPDGSTWPVPAVEATDQLSLTIQTQLPHEKMQAPVHLDPALFSPDEGLFDYALVERLQFGRPVYIRVLAVLLVLLIAAAAAYAVFMRPLHELVINAGGLVLGVWGIRSILTPGSMSYLTAVDLALAAVILFLLGAITVRALQFCYGQSSLAPLFRRAPDAHRAGAAAESAERQADPR